MIIGYGNGQKKGYTAERYSVLEKLDKGIDINKCFFEEKIERKLERGSI